MTATEDLRNEHEGIRLMLRILAAVAEKVKKGASVPAGDLEAMADFLSGFADRCHHGKEEDHLFPSLEAAGVLREGGPIGVMLAEHAKGRSFIADLKEGIAGLEAGRRDAPEKFVSAAQGYVDLLTRHITKENEVLFPMAEARLDPGQHAALLEAFEQLEQERIGPGKHEEFHRLLQRLNRTYLG
jgi:hemerythrin-like domain-containing protein